MGGERGGEAGRRAKGAAQALRAREPADRPTARVAESEAAAGGSVAWGTENTVPQRDGGIGAVEGRSDDAHGGRQGAGAARCVETPQPSGP